MERRIFKLVAASSLLNSENAEKTNGALLRGLTHISRASEVRRRRAVFRFYTGNTYRTIDKDHYDIYAVPCKLDTLYNLKIWPDHKKGIFIDDELLCYILGFYVLQRDGEGSVMVDGDGKPMIVYDRFALKEYKRKFRRFAYLSLVLYFNEECYAVMEKLGYSRDLFKIDVDGIIEYV